MSEQDPGLVWRKSYASRRQHLLRLPDPPLAGVVQRQALCGMARVDWAKYGQGSVCQTCMDTAKRNGLTMPPLPRKESASDEIQKRQNDVQLLYDALMEIRDLPRHRSDEAARVARRALDILTERSRRGDAVKPGSNPPTAPKTGPF